METFKIIMKGPVLEASKGALKGVTAGTTFGAFFCATSEALGTTMIGAEFGQSDAVSAGALMGAAGGAVLAGSIGFFSGACVNLSQKGYLTFWHDSPFNSIAVACLAVIICGLPLAAGAIGQGLLKNKTIGTGESALYCFFGSIMIGFAASVVAAIGCYVAKHFSCRLHPMDDTQPAQNLIAEV